MDDLKKTAAEKAVDLIKQQTIVGIGDGSTMAYIAGILEKKVKQGFEVKLLTSSPTTKQLLLDYGLKVHSINEFTHIDQYFDGCDQFDHQLNALKSGNGIHTREKLVAQLATEFFLVGDEKKLVERFSPSVPLVIELLPDALSFISSQIRSAWPGANFKLREHQETNAFIHTINNNWLLDVWFTEWPDLKTVHEFFNGITGVVAISLFYQMATSAIIASTDGVRILSKEGEAIQSFD